MRKRKPLDPIDRALEQEPAFKELCRLLDRQTPQQRARFDKWISQECEGSQKEDAPMKTKKEDLTARLIQLKKHERRPWSEVLERLEQEGFGKMTKFAAQKRIQRSLKSQPPQPDETPAPEEQPCEPCEPTQLIPPEWVEPLRALIREEISRTLANPAHYKEVAYIAKLPPRPRTGRKLKGEKVTMPGCRVDKTLFELFERRRIDREISASALLEEALWVYFGQPKLSYQLDDADDSAQSGGRK